MVICITVMASQEITNSGGKDTRPGAEYVLTTEELAIFARVFVCVRSVLIITHISVARFTSKNQVARNNFNECILSKMLIERESPLHHFRM